MTSCRVMKNGIMRTDSPDSSNFAEYLLQQNSETLSVIIDAAPVAIIALDQSAKVLVWNHAAERLFGWSRDEVIGKPYPLVPDSEISEFKALIDREFRGERHSAKDIKRLHKDGSLIDASIWTAPMLDANGRMFAVLGMLADNTERKKKEQLIHLQSSALNASANGVMITDRDGIIQWVNPAFTTLTGYCSDEVVGKNPRELVKSGEHDQAYYRNMWETIISGRVWQGEIINRQKDGSLYYENQTISPVRDEHGEVSHFIDIKQDITERKKAEESLKLFRALIEQSNDAIEIIDPETGRYLDINEKGCSELGYDREEILNLAVFDIDPRVDEPTFRDKVEDLKKTKTLTWESVHKRKNGTAFPVEVNMKYVSLDRDYIVAVVRDITERKVKDERIMRLNRVYKVLSSINTLILRVKEREELFRKACQIAVKDGQFCLAWIGGVSNQDRTLSTWACAGHESDLPEYVLANVDNEDFDHAGPIIQAIRLKKPVIVNRIGSDDSVWMTEALTQGCRSFVVLPLMVAGEVEGVIALCASAPDFFDDEEMNLLTELAGDVSFALHNIGQREKVDFLASYDTLTGLPNRRLFTEHLDSVLGRAGVSGKNVALMVCDLKQFHNINNVYGPGVGDLILQETARRLRDLTLDPVNIGRMTGDYFVMILHDVHDASGIPYMLENTFFPVLNAPFLINDNEIQISFSAGLAVYPADGMNAETLYRNAEAALKKAVTCNSQYLFYRSDMMEGVAEKVFFENKLRRALNENEFVLYYQPKVDSGTHEITGFEALIRWNDPDTGLILPDRFIPILEETGMILKVGSWAMEKALQDMQQWKDAGMKILRIAVNVSPLQLQQDDFSEVVGDIVNRYGGKTCGLDMEMTENLLMQNIDLNISKLAGIREQGVDIAIDDFGTGYSSLSYLARLPVNSLKIDRSFIASMDSLPESLTIVSSIISLAHALNMKVIAEGVETEEQSKLLRLLKCDEMQGFLFSKPVPPQDVPGLFESIH